VNAISAMPITTFSSMAAEDFDSAVQSLSLLPLNISSRSIGRTT
jgi:enoyl-[acyl-carrier-protein] reductase (NADH)